jgi:hypothetical protein
MNTTNSSNQNKTAIQILVLSVLCVALAVLAVSSGVFKPKGGPRVVGLRVTSSNGMALIKYSYPSLPAKDFAQETTPWERSVSLKNGDAVNLSAGNPSTYGSVTCTISVDNKVWKTVTAAYPEDKVGCAGIIP